MLTLRCVSGWCVYASCGSFEVANSNAQLTVSEIEAFANTPAGAAMVETPIFNFHWSTQLLQSAVASGQIEIGTSIYFDFIPEVAVHYRAALPRYTEAAEDWAEQVLHSPTATALHAVEEGLLSIQAHQNMGQPPEGVIPLVRFPLLMGSVQMVFRVRTMAIDYECVELGSE